MAEKRGLGRGLSALIGDTSDLETNDTPGAVTSKPDRLLPIEMVEPNPDQPRQDFDRNHLQELADSIRQKGILQPLLVRASAEAGKYQIVAGERRWRAAQIANVHEVPVLIRDYTDEEVLEIAIIENVQRADLNAMEESLAFQQLIDKFGYTQEQLATSLSKSRSHIANLLRLQNLPDMAKEMLRRGELTAGHARALLTAQHPMQLARQIIDKGLSVREAERLAKSPQKITEKKPKQVHTKDADTLALENDLAATLGMKVSIEHKDGTEGGKVSINYRDLNDLDMLCQALSAIDRMAH